jgi:mycothiol synthase
MRITRLEDEDFDWAGGAGGAAEVRRVVDASQATDGHEILNEAAVLTLHHRGLGTGVLLLAEQGERAGQGAGALGFAYVHGLSGPGRPELDLAVAPDCRRQGVGRALLDAVEDALAGIPLTAWSHGDHPGAAALAARTGYRAVRELWLMRRPADAPSPARRSGTPYRLRAFRPGADDAAFLALNAEAFASHPEQGALDQHGLLERTSQEWFDPEGFLVAETPAGDGLAGFHWTKVHPAAGQRPVGEVYVIGVAPAAQGTGLGRQLLTAGLDHLRGRGVAEVILYVEADNTTAVRLYESFGFDHALRDTDVMYAR